MYVRKITTPRRCCRSLHTELQHMPVKLQKSNDTTYAYVRSLGSNVGAIENKSNGDGDRLQPDSYISTTCYGRIEPSSSTCSQNFVGSMNSGTSFANVTENHRYRCSMRKVKYNVKSELRVY
ncbi:unnamed protein product [Adineta ricciae]|uniref:Uncharacterized protein n=1 Tax=Adineta ricciae TaxID=249248 RepID=A0A815MG35_ADIRI|nr:unnamed protein product [Adineta ricciae]